MNWKQNLQFTIILKHKELREVLDKLEKYIGYFFTTYTIY